MDDQTVKSVVDQALLQNLANSINKDMKSQVASAGAYDLLDIPGMIPTGIEALDATLGGGFPMGRIVQVAGWEAQGKSTLADHVMANCQRMGGLAALIDADSGGRDPNRSQKIGVDVRSLLPLDVETTEEGFTASNLLITKLRADTVMGSDGKEAPNPLLGRPIAIVWDSIAATPNAAEYQNFQNPQNDKYADGMMAKPKALRWGLRNMAQDIRRHKVCFIVINQVMENRDNPYDPSILGGGALKYFPSVTLLVRRVGKIENELQQQIGMDVEIKIRKSRICRPYQNIKVPLFYETGYDNDITNWGALQGSKEDPNSIFFTAGSWSYFRFNGRDMNFRWKDFKKILDDTPGSREFVKTKVYEKLAPGWWKEKNLPALKKAD